MTNLNQSNSLADLAVRISPSMRPYWPETAGHYVEWLKRNGWNSPSEWHGEEGDKYRKRLGMRPVHDLSNVAGKPSFMNKPANQPPISRRISGPLEMNV